MGFLDRLPLLQDSEFHASSVMSWDVLNITSLVHLFLLCEQGVHDAQTEHIALAMRPPQLEKTVPSPHAPPSASVHRVKHRVYHLLPVCLRGFA